MLEDDQFLHPSGPLNSPSLDPQALLLSGRRAGPFTYIYTEVGKLSLLMSMCPDGSGESYDK